MLPTDRCFNPIWPKCDKKVLEEEETKASRILNRERMTLETKGRTDYSIIISGIGITPKFFSEHFIQIKLD